MSNLQEKIESRIKQQKMADKAFLEMLNEIFITYPLVETLDIRVLTHKGGYILGAEFLGFNKIELCWGLEDKKANLLELDLKPSDVLLMKKIKLENAYLYSVIYYIMESTVSGFRVRLNQNEIKDLITKIDIDG